MSARQAKVILIVEDYADDAQILHNLLEQMSIRNVVRIVFSAYDAMSYLKGMFPYVNRTENPLPDVVFVDLKLPGMNGYELIEWIRSRPELKQILVVAISGVDDLRSVQRAYSLGANSFLAKPYQEIEIEHLIRTYPGFWTRPPPPEAGT